MSSCKIVVDSWEMGFGWTQKWAEKEPKNKLKWAKKWKGPFLNSLLLIFGSAQHGLILGGSELALFLAAPAPNLCLFLTPFQPSFGCHFSPLTDPIKI